MIRPADNPSLGLALGLYVPHLDKPVVAHSVVCHASAAISQSVWCTHCALLVLRMLCSPAVAAQAGKGNRASQPEAYHTTLHRHVISTSGISVTTLWTT